MEVCCFDGQDVDYYYDIEKCLVEYLQVFLVIYLCIDFKVCYECMFSCVCGVEDGILLSYFILLLGMYDVLLLVICNKYNM